MVPPPAPSLHRAACLHLLGLRSGEARLHPADGSLRADDKSWGRYETVTFVSMPASRWPGTEQ